MKQQKIVTTVEDFKQYLVDEVKNAKYLPHVEDAKRDLVLYSFLIRLYETIYRSYYNLDEDAKIKLHFAYNKGYVEMREVRMPEDRYNIVEISYSEHNPAVLIIKVPKDAADDILLKIDAWDLLDQSGILDRAINFYPERPVPDNVIDKVRAIEGNWYEVTSYHL